MNFKFDFKVKLAEGMQLRSFRIDYKALDADELELMIDPADETRISGSIEITSSFSTIEIDLFGRGASGQTATFNVYRNGNALFPEDVTLHTNILGKFKYRNKKVNF